MTEKNPYEWFGGEGAAPGNRERHVRTGAGVKPDLFLLGLAIVYPVASFAAMYVAAGYQSMFHIPSYCQYIFFVYVLPSFTVAAIFLARVLGIRFWAVGIGGFVVWMVLVASFTKDVIEAVWSAP
jgi:hypothetical protein